MVKYKIWFLLALDAVIKLAMLAAVIAIPIVFDFVGHMNGNKWITFATTFVYCLSSTVVYIFLAGKVTKWIKRKVVEVMVSEVFSGDDV